MWSLWETALLAVFHRIHALFVLASFEFGRVLHHVLCSDLDQAADWYERAINARDPFALVFAATDLVSELRQSSHWPKLARIMNMPSHD